MTPSGRILRVGVAGLGRAARFTIPALAAHPRVQIAAGADLRHEARDRLAADFEVETYESVEDLCQRPDLDGIYIATPPQRHREHVIEAANHGKHVICEKPMALTIADCEAMNEAVERNRVRLVVGHTHSFDPFALKMREIVVSGKLGRLGMINTWNFTDWLYRARRPEELDPALGGVIFNQVPHQIDTVRLIGGGLVQSVVGATGTWDPARPTVGAHAAFLRFTDGVAATIVYSGYDHFDSDEFHYWLGEGGRAKSPDGHGRARQALANLGGPAEEAARAAANGYSGAAHLIDAAAGGEGGPHFGVTIASCEQGDLRASPRGVYVYGDAGRREELIAPRPHADRMNVIDEFYSAVVEDRPPPHDGRWAEATVEVCLAILESAAEHREVALAHQVPLKGDFEAAG